jgi:coproporphyrinogen III oxidase-like Fe-S oxidoreductase
LEGGGRAIESREQLAPLSRAGETAAFGLRMNAGWPFDLFQATTGFDLREEWQAEMDELVANGLGERDARRFRLTDRGLRLADSVGTQFLRPEGPARRPEPVTCATSEL